VTLTIDDPDTPESPDYQDTRSVEYDEWGTWVTFFVHLERPPEDTFQTGDLVTLTDGTYTETTIVTNLGLLQINPDANTVYSTAEAGTQVKVGVHGMEEEEVIADVMPDGTWSADLTGIIDFVMGMNSGSVYAYQDDSCGHQTLVRWEVPQNPPFLLVEPERDMVWAWNWPMFSEVMMTIDDPSTTGLDYQEEHTVTIQDYGMPAMLFELDGFDIQPGFIVEINHWWNIRTHEITLYTVDNVDPETGFAEGTAEPNSELLISGCWDFADNFGPYGPICPHHLTYADQNGHWEASLYGLGWDYLRPGFTISFLQEDADHDFTGMLWRNLPVFTVASDGIAIWGSGWDEGTEVILTIDDPSNGPGVDYTDTQTSVWGEWGTEIWFFVYRGDLWFEAINPGDIITLSDGIYTKTHEVTNLQPLQADPIRDVIFSSADAGSQVVVEIEGDDEYQQTINVGGDGLWEVDLSDKLDFYPGMEFTTINARQKDSDGDQTLVRWETPEHPAYILVEPEEGIIWAWNWPMYEQVQLTIDDPSRSGIEYNQYHIINERDYGLPSKVFHIPDGLLTPGNLVQLNHWWADKEHQITNLVVDKVNTVTGIADGTADPGSEVYIAGCWELSDNYGPYGPTCPHLVATTDPTGYWEANLLGLGRDYLQPGYRIEFVQQDDDLDFTGIFWQNRKPIADIGGPYSGNEGDTLLLDGSGSWDPDGNLLYYSWELDNDGDYDDAEGVTAEVLFEDDGIYPIGFAAQDHYLMYDIDTTDVTIVNVAPVLDEITGPLEPVSVGIPIEVAALFTDPGTLDSHTASWDWGDGNITEGSISAYEASGSYAYQTPGVYTITLTVTDDDGGSGSAIYEYAVVYDPEGGFVTGGGWIHSPEGAYTPDPSLSGKATFGFVSKYKKGADLPTGNTEFHFKTADFHFKSTTYQWLVVAGKKAMFKGEGEINGQAGYGFMISAWDGDLQGGDGIDKFRVKIWELGSEIVVYDNELGAADDADPNTELGGGSTVIHK
jgi:hypothetical protein